MFKSTSSSGVLKKHLQEHHSQEVVDPMELFQMKIEKGSRTILDRLVTEGVAIANMDQEEPEYLMNSKAEWGRGKLIRFMPTVTRI